MKHSKRIKTKGRMLNEIMRWKQQELARQKSLESEANLRALASFSPPTHDFAAAVASPGLAIIPEIKRASPHAGLLSRQFDSIRIAVAFAEAGAAAIAVATDARYFQGQLEDVTAIKQALSDRKMILPVLRKDFIFDSYQLLASRVAGADAVVLIVGALGDRELRELVNYARELNIAVVLEVHTEQDVQRALQCDSRLISISNRDWRHDTVDLEVSVRLRPLLPDHVLAFSDGGIRTPEDIKHLTDLRFHAAIVGTVLMRSPHEQRKYRLRELINASKKNLPGP